LSLFEQKAPILVEVRIPRMATSPDWFLCETTGDFDPVRDRLKVGVHLLALEKPHAPIHEVLVDGKYSRQIVAVRWAGRSELNVQLLSNNLVQKEFWIAPN
jgi:hypothetical protein